MPFEENFTEEPYWEMEEKQHLSNKTLTYKLGWWHKLPIHIIMLPGSCSLFDYDLR